MFPVDVINIIVEYAFEYELLDWVDEKNLDWSSLSLNSNAINLIEKNLDKVNWKILSRNPAIFKDNKKELLDILIKCI